MENYSESERWMKDARDCFNHAQRCFNEGYWRGAVQNAQLAIELSVKAVIALFEEQDWTHSPDGQLNRIIEDKKEEIKTMFGYQFLNLLSNVIEDIRVSAPWHGLSVYGKEKDDGSGWIPVVDLCTEDIAKELVTRAQRTITVVEEFLRGIK